MNETVALEELFSAPPRELRRPMVVSIYTAIFVANAIQAVAFASFAGVIGAALTAALAFFAFRDDYNY